MTDLEARLAAGPDSILEALRVCRRPIPLSDSYSWHGLAEGAASNANVSFRQGEVATGLSWARCAVALYDALSSDVAESNSFDLSGRQLRMNAIRACGALAGDAVLDPSVVLTWVRASFGCSPAEAIERSAEFLKVPREGGEPSLQHARELRRIKNRLTVLGHLPPAVLLDAELRAWLELTHQLV